MFYFDKYTLLFVLPALLLGLWAQAKVNGNFKKYSAVRSRRGYTADQVAREILRSYGIGDIDVQRISGSLTDHFDPRQRVIRLSDTVYGSSSIAAIGVAAHEAGHAVQYSVRYKPIQLRNAFVPVANIGSSLSVPLIILGAVMSFQPLVTAGILLFSAIAVFQLLTLPVEFNASNRALAVLDEQEFLSGEELKGAQKVLSSAALTYVAALLTSVAQLLRLIGLYGNRGRRD